MGFINFMIDAARNILAIGLGFVVFYVIIRYGRKIVHIILKALKKGLKTLDRKLDAKELATAKTLRKKEHIRTTKLREEFFKVAAYIALAFKNLQQHSTIWLPYNFE